MKKVIYSMVSIAILSLASCGGGGWTDGEKETYMKECKKGLDEKTCQCMLDKIVEKYDDPKALQAAMDKDMEAVMEIAKACL